MFAKMLEMLGLKKEPEAAEVSVEMSESAPIFADVHSRIYQKTYADMLALARKAALPNCCI